MLLGIIKGLETLCDVLEYGPAEAVKINTSFCPEAERSYREVMGNINNPSSVSSSFDEGETDGHKLKDDEPEEFGKLIEDIKTIFPVEFSNIDLRLIYDYAHLNTYGKVIMDKVNSGKSDRVAALCDKEQLEMAVLFKEKCQKGECDKYSFIFWALMVLTVDDTDKEEHLSQICDLSRYLEINEEELMNIVRLIYAVYQNK